MALPNLLPLRHYHLKPPNKIYLTGHIEVILSLIRSSLKKCELIAFLASNTLLGH